MNDAHSSELISQPLLELLHSAGTFGSDFDRSGKLSHLVETLENVRSLKDRALLAARTVSELLDKQITDAIDQPIHPGAPAASAFLTELTEDLSAIERRIADRLIALTAADGSECEAA
jgi:hypothetical protein